MTDQIKGRKTHRSWPTHLRAVGDSFSGESDAIRQNGVYAHPASLEASGIERKPIHIPNDFQYLDISYDSKERILWYYMNLRRRPSFTLELLQDIRALQQYVVNLFAEDMTPEEAPIRYLVAASAEPRIFNLGGDLRLIKQLVLDRNRPRLEAYARACIDVLHPNAMSMHLPLITVSLVEGHALGGGFEAALSSNLVVADENAKFGLPEILFNLFPGMGAYSLLARRLGPVGAERLILSGKVYGAAELHEMGVVDVLAPAGQAEAAMLDYIQSHSRRFGAHLGIYQARQRYQPLTYRELSEIAGVWVETALRLNERDLRKIDRLAASQDRLAKSPG